MAVIGFSGKGTKLKCIKIDLTVRPIENGANFSTHERSGRNVSIDCPERKKNPSLADVGKQYSVCDVGMYVMREVADDLPGHLSRRPRSVTDSKNSPSAI